jgi:hypothetical protein
MSLGTKLFLESKLFDAGRIYTEGARLTVPIPRGWSGGMVERGFSAVGGLLLLLRGRLAKPSMKACRCYFVRSCHALCRGRR